MTNIDRARFAAPRRAADPVVIDGGRNRPVDGEREGVDAVVNVTGPRPLGQKGKPSGCGKGEPAQSRRTGGAVGQPPVGRLHDVVTVGANPMFIPGVQI
jgi:hypothetical protein